MKVAVFGPDRRVGLIRDSELIDINLAYAKFLKETGVARWSDWSCAHAPADLGSFVAEGQRALDSAEQAVAYLDTSAQDATGPAGTPVRHSLGDVRLHPPIPAPDCRFMMAFANFAEHVRDHRRNKLAEELTLEQVVSTVRQAGPAHFLKHVRTIVGPGAPVRYPARTERFDYEAEIVVVLGRTVRDQPAGQFAPCVWGYTLTNDWSIRDYPNSARDFPYTKNFDTASSLGPWITVGEIPDPQDIAFTAHLNGELRQAGSTRDMIFSFGELAEYLSRDLTLQPGDMISSGTPSGTAHDSSPLGPDGKALPDRFLQPGDEVEVTAPAIGSLRNHVIKG